MLYALPPGLLAHEDVGEMGGNKGLNKSGVDRVRVIWNEKSETLGDGRIEVVTEVDVLFRSGDVLGMEESMLTDELVRFFLGAGTGWNAELLAGARRSSQELIPLCVIHAAAQRSHLCCLSESAIIWEMIYRSAVMASR